MAPFQMRSLTPIAKKPKSEVDQMVQEALSKEKWNAPNSLLHNLAVRTLKDPSAKDAILPPVWKMLEASSKEWRRVFKALALAEALLKRASMQTVEEIRQNTWKAAKWREQKIMEEGKDVGGGLREKARLICELCEDTDLLGKERRKNDEITRKMNGLGQRPAAIDAEKENTNILQRTAAAFMPTTPRKAPEREEEPSGFHAFNEADLEAAAVERDGAGGRKPEFKQLRDMCAHVQKATGLSAGEAMQLLKEMNWNVSEAIYAAGMMARKEPNNVNPAGGANSDSDDSDSDSDSDSSDDEPPAPALGKGAKGGKAGGKGGPKGGYGAAGAGGAKGMSFGGGKPAAGGDQQGYQPAEAMFGSTPGAKGGWSAAGKGKNPQQAALAGKGDWAYAASKGGAQQGKGLAQSPGKGLGKGQQMGGKGGAAPWQQPAAIGQAW